MHPMVVLEKRLQLEGAVFLHFLRLCCILSKGYTSAVFRQLALENSFPTLERRQCCAWWCTTP
eukprot:6951086-Ditylum_brightwellii.AAC.1